MSQFDEKELNTLMRLCRIDCTGEEKKKLQESLPKVLAYIALLDEVDTTGTLRCSHVLEGGENVVREDLVSDVLPRALFLEEVPAHVGGMVRVPPVIKFSNP